MKPRHVSVGEGRSVPKKLQFCAWLLDNTELRNNRNFWRAEGGSLSIPSQLYFACGEGWVRLCVKMRPPKQKLHIRVVESFLAERFVFFLMCFYVVMFADYSPCHAE